MGPPLWVEYKADRSPVTVADRESEQLLRRLIEERYPEHGILGEEFGLTRGGAALRWYLDPIDGTQSFIRGVPLFGVMVGLAAKEDAPNEQVVRPLRRAQDDSGENDFDPVVGVVHLPALGETVVGWRGGGCWWRGGQGQTEGERGQTGMSVPPGEHWERAHVSATGRLEEALLLSSDPLDIARSSKRAAYERLRQRVKVERGWGDCYGYVLVATGRAEIMLDAALHEWDAAPLIPLLEEAGGRFADWKGRRTFSGGDGFATNEKLFAGAMRILQGKIERSARRDAEGTERKGHRRDRRETRGQEKTGWGEELQKQDGGG